MNLSHITYLFFFTTLITYMSCKDNDHTYPNPPGSNENKFDEEIKHAISPDSIIRYTVFSAGDNNVNTYRIPSMVTSKNGTLVVACEARKTSWRDKSPTDIAIKRSTDEGKTWSNVQFVTNGAKDNFAFMDPCLVVDYTTGKVYLFVCRWPESPQDGSANVPFLLTSIDDGVSWTEPESVMNDVVIPGGSINGFGPGSGIQMVGNKYKNRLIVPTRLRDAQNRARNRVVYSDDHGLTWQIGGEAPRTGEFQIAETPLDGLYYNLRLAGGRAACYSSDGGLSWGADILDKDLPSTVGGCHGSVFGADKVLIYCGIEGGVALGGYDDRRKLTLFRSTSSGYKWGNKFLLYDKAAGYSCMSKLNNGKIAIIFEAGDDNGFTKAANRLAGWMRLDLFILPAETLVEGHWFTK